MRTVFALLTMLAVPVFAAVEIKGATFRQSVTTQDTVLQLDGAGLLKWRGLVSVYAAALYRERPDTGFPADPGETKRLEIEYLRDIKREDLVKATSLAFERTLPEGESVAQWQAQLDAFAKGYDNVSKGDRYALETGPFGFRLLLNGEERSAGDDAAFGQRVIGIWLAEDTPSASLREALLAQN